MMTLSSFKPESRGDTSLPGQQNKILNDCANMVRVWIDELEILLLTVVEIDGAMKGYGYLS